MKDGSVCITSRIGVMIARARPLCAISTASGSPIATENSTARPVTISVSMLSS